MANTPSLWQPADTDLNAAGNWTGAVPGIGIDSIFGDYGHGDATTDTTIANSATFVTRPDYKGNIGTSGTFVNHGLNVNRWVIRHRGDFYWGGPAAASGQMVIDRGMGSQGTCQLKGILTRLYVKSGDVQVLSTGTFASATSGTWFLLSTNQSRLTIDAADAAELLPLVTRVDAGVLNNARDYTQSAQMLLINGGNVLQTGLLQNSMIVRISGGVLTYEPASDPAAETPIIFVDGGILDVRGSQWAIPALIEIGVGGVLLGSAIDKVSGYYDLDLNEPYP
jgi:hypothetical protein